MRNAQSARAWHERAKERAAEKKCWSLEEFSSKSCDLSSLSGWTLAGITSLEGSWGTRCHLSSSILGSPASDSLTDVTSDVMRANLLDCAARNGILRTFASHGLLTSSFQFTAAASVSSAPYDILFCGTDTFASASLSALLTHRLASAHPCTFSHLPTWHKNGVPTG